MDIHAKLRRLKAGHGVELVIVDYLQLMSAAGASKTATRRSAPSRVA